MLGLHCCLWAFSSYRETAAAAAAAAKSLQLCPTLCDPIDGSPPGSAIPGILQARTLEWAAISFSNAWKWKVKVKSLSRVWLLATPLTAAYQAPPSVGFSRQEYWSGVPLPSPTETELLSNGNAWASHCSGFSYCRAQALRSTGFSGCSACGIWNLPAPGIKPVSLALAAGFLHSPLVNGPPEKSKKVTL